MSCRIACFRVCAPRSRRRFLLCNMVKLHENLRNVLKTLFVLEAVRYKLLIPQTRFRATPAGFFVRMGELFADEN
jgi:hypothetical protein